MTDEMCISSVINNNLVKYNKPWLNAEGILDPGCVALVSCPGIKSPISLIHFGNIYN